MRIYLGAVGTLKDGAERSLFERYAHRFDQCGQQVRIGPLAVAEVPESRARSVSQRMKDEGAALLKKIPAESILIALDEKAAGFGSRALAGMLEKDRDDGARSLAFLIGGADGHGDDLLTRAHRKLSLGQMTYPHGLARIILAEQLYRATTILSGHPYHRDGR